MESFYHLLCPISLNFTLTLSAFLYPSSIYPALSKLTLPHTYHSCSTLPADDNVSVFQSDKYLTNLANLTPLSNILHQRLWEDFPELGNSGTMAYQWIFFGWRKGSWYPSKRAAVWPILQFWLTVKWSYCKRVEEFRNKEIKQEQNAKKMGKEPLTSQK